MRSMWKGFVTFGLVTIPVRLYSAVESSESVKFNLLHAKDKGRIHYKRVCDGCGKEVPWDDIVKGYQFAEDEFVEMTDEDFAKADIGASQSIDVQDFVLQEEIDPKYFEHPYYLEPQKGAEKPYALFREALRASGKVGVAKVVLRSGEQLACLKPDGDVILVEVMRYAEQVRSPAELKVPPRTEVKDRELQLAHALIDQMTGTFKIEDYRDEYREKLQAVIREKVEGVTPSEHGTAPMPTKVIDLMKVLQQSLEQRAREAAPGKGTAKPDGDEGEHKDAEKPAARRRKGKAA